MAWAVFTSADKGNSYDLRIEEVVYGATLLYFIIKHSRHPNVY